MPQVGHRKAGDIQVAGRGRNRWWVAVAVVGVVAAALWAVAGVRVLRAHHQAAGTGTPTGAAARSSQGSGTAADSSPGVVSPHLLGSAPASAPVVAMAFTPDGKTLAVRLGTGLVQLRDPATGAVRSTVGRGSQPTASVAGALAISPDGTIIAIGANPDRGPSSAVDLISLATGKLTATIPVGSPVVYSLTFSPDGKTLAIGAGQYLFLVNLATRATISVSTSEGEFTGDSRYVSYSAGGKFLAVANNVGLIKLWDVRATGFTKSTTVSSAQDTESVDITAATISPDGATVALSGDLSGYDASGTGYENPETWLWHPSTGQVRPLQPTAAQGAVMDGIEAQAFSPDGKLIATGDDAGAVRLWDTTTGKLIATEHAPSPITPVTAVAFAPDSKSLVTAQSLNDAPQAGNATIQLWGLNPAAGDSGAGNSSPASPAPAALQPGVYQVNRVIEISGSWVIKLESVQVADSGKATFIVTTENIGTVGGQVSCAGSSNPLEASITLATGRVANSVDAYCAGYPDESNINVGPQGSVTSYVVFANSQGLGQAFTFDWSGPSGLSGALSGITLSR